MLDATTAPILLGRVANFATLPNNWGGCGTKAWGGSEGTRNVDALLGRDSRGPLQHGGGVASEGRWFTTRYIIQAMTINKNYRPVGSRQQRLSGVSMVSIRCFAARRCWN